MRVAAVIAAALLLTGCSWVHKELPWTTTPPAPSAPATPPAARPEPAPRPRPHAERPPSAAAAAKPAEPAPVAAAPAEPPIDYAARCRTMADNRADDAKGLGASPPDQARMRDETYRDCMQQSVK